VPLTIAKSSDSSPDPDEWNLIYVQAVQSDRMTQADKVKKCWSPPSDQTRFQLCSTSRYPGTAVVHYGYFTMVLGGTLASLLVGTLIMNIMYVSV
jgi:hypothetical protein